MKGTVKYNPTTKTLTLKDAEITPSGTQECIKTYIEGFIIDISGNNKLTGNGYAPIACKDNGSLIIQGSGTLNAYNAKKDDTAIWSDKGSITISNITLIAKGGRNAIALGNWNNSEITINNATVTVSLNDDGVRHSTIVGFKKMNLNGSVISSPRDAEYNTADGKRTICLISSGDVYKGELKIIPGSTYDLWICGVQVTDGNRDNLVHAINGAGGCLLKGLVTYYPENNILELSSSGIVLKDKPRSNIAIESKIEGLTIRVKESSTILSNIEGSYGMVLHNSTIITSNSNRVLKVHAYAESLGTAISVTGGTLKVSTCKLEINGSLFGIRGEGVSSLEIYGTDVTAIGSEEGSICDFKEIKLYQSVISEPKGADIEIVKNRGYCITDASSNIVKDTVKIVPSDDAAIYPILINYIPVTSYNKDNLQDFIPGVTGQVSYNPDTHTLRLKNATINTIKYTGIQSNDMEGLTIELVGNNTLITGYYSGINILEGNCTISSSNSGILTLGQLKTYGPLSIKNCTVNSNSYLDSGSQLIVDGANLTTTGIMRFTEGITLKRCAITQPTGGQIINGDVCDANGNRANSVVISAESYDLQICGEQVTALNMNNLNLINGVTGNVTYNDSTKTLRLENATITGSSSVGTINSGIDGLNIEVVENNTVSNSNPYSFSTISIDKKCTILGSGTLNIINTTTTGKGIYSYKALLTIRDCTVNITANYQGISGFNGRVEDVLSIENATVTINETQNSAIRDYNEIKLINCVIAEPAGAVFNQTEKALCYTDGTFVKAKVKIVPGTTYDLKICGVPVTSQNKDNLRVIPGVSAGTVKYNPDTKTLRLESATITGVNNVGAIRSEIEGVTIEVIGNNTVTNNGVSAIKFYEKSGTILGSGTLTVTNQANDFAIYAQNTSLTIKNCTLNATGGRRGITGSGNNGTLTIDKATVTAKGNTEGSITRFAEITLKGCIISQPTVAVINKGTDEYNAVRDALGNIIKETVKIIPGGTGIDEICANAVTLYPNPVQDILHIQAEETVNAVSIFNLQGKAVAEATGNVSEINLTHLPAGIYMVHVVIGETVSTARIIKK